jgi:SAM-dependent methyltransferase
MLLFFVIIFSFYVYKQYRSITNEINIEYEIHLNDLEALYPVSKVNQSIYIPHIDIPVYYKIIDKIEANSYFDKIHKRLQNPIIKKYKRLLSNYIDIYKPNTVLEIGCGKGYLLREFAMKYPNIQFIGMDMELLPAMSFISPKNIKWIDSFMERDWYTCLGHKKIDMIFSINSAMYMDTKEKRRQLIENIEEFLSYKGYYLLIDNYRDKGYLSHHGAFIRMLYLYERITMVRSLAMKRDWKEMAKIFDLKYHGYIDWSETLLDVQNNYVKHINFYIYFGAVAHFIVELLLPPIHYIYMAIYKNSSLAYALDKKLIRHGVCIFQKLTND